MTDEEIKSCPFCGAEDPKYNDENGGYIQCKCCSSVFENPLVITKDHLIGLWNERSEELKSGSCDNFGKCGNCLHCIDDDCDNCEKQEKCNHECCKSSDNCEMTTKDNDSQVDLLPCPFCGKEPELVRDSLNNVMLIRCSKCNMAMYISDRYEEKWNTRVGTISKKERVGGIGTNLELAKLWKLKDDECHVHVGRSDYDGDTRITIMILQPDDNGKERRNIHMSLEEYKSLKRLMDELEEEGVMG